MEEKDYYELLEISRNASDEVVKNAYRALAKKYHPDTANVDKELIEKNMKQINEAYEVLSSKEKRAIYDQELKEKELELKQERYNYDFKENKKVNDNNQSNENNNKKSNSKKIVIICIIGFFFVSILSFIIMSIVIEPTDFENKRENVTEKFDKEDIKDKSENKKVNKVEQNYFEEDYEVDTNNVEDVVEKDIVNQTEEQDTEKTENTEIEDNIIKIY